MFNMVGAVFIESTADLTIAKIHPAVVFFSNAANGTPVNSRSACNLVKKFFAVIVNLAVQVSLTKKLRSEEKQEIKNGKYGR